MLRFHPIEKRIIPVAFAFALYPLSQLSAQSTAVSATNPPPKSNSSEEDHVTLDEFTVTSGSTHGYVASESMTGTRVATKIADLPFSVNVVTSEFFKDFAMFELNENLAYISSFNGLDQGGGYNLRGFNQTYQLRDGFFRLGRYGTSNVDRVEIIKGPNASIYGQTQPGGILNMISKRPKSQESEEIDYSFGSYDTERTTVEATGPLGILPDTNYIVDFGHYQRGYDTPGKKLRNKEHYIALDHAFSPTSKLFVNFEYLLRVQDSPVDPIPYRFDPTKITPLTPTGQYVGIANELANFNQNGPQAQQNRSIAFSEVTYDNQLSDVWSFRLGGNWGHAHNWNFNNVNTQQYFIAASGTTPANSLARAAPSKGLIDEVTLNIQADLFAHWWMFNHKVENKDLFTFDLADYYRFDPTWTLKAGVPRGTTTIIVGQPIDFFAPPYDTINYVNGYGVPGNTTGRWRKNRATDWGDLYRHQSSFFDGKLLTYLGARYDEVKLRLRNYVGVLASNPVTLKDNLQRWSPNGGALYKVTPNVSLYGNYSTGFNPLVQNQDAKTPLPFETDWGYDYGTKLAFFDERLNITLGGYYIVRNNVVSTDTDAQGNTINVPEGSQLVRGEELEVTYNVSDAVSFGGSYGHVDSRVTNDGNKFMSIGRSPARIPANNAGAYVKYTFTHGRFKGFSANLGMIYTGPFHPEANNAGDTYTAVKDASGRQIGLTYTTNNLWALTAPGAVIWNGGIHYQFKTGGRIPLAHEISFNFNNLFDRYYITTVRTPGDGQSFFMTYSLKH